MQRVPGDKSRFIIYYTFLVGVHKLKWLLYQEKKLPNRCGAPHKTRGDSYFPLHDRLALFSSVMRARQSANNSVLQICSPTTGCSSLTVSQHEPAQAVHAFGALGQTGATFRDKLASSSVAPMWLPFISGGTKQQQQAQQGRPTGARLSN